MANTMDKKPEELRRWNEIVINTDRFFDDMTYGKNFCDLLKDIKDEEVLKAIIRRCIMLCY